MVQYWHVNLLIINLLFMKKILSSISLFAAIIIPLISIISLPKETGAQNIGSLQSVVTPGFSFRKDLQLADTDPDVKELQRVLNASVDTMVDIQDAGSPGQETTYFGEKTKIAVIKFQNKYKDVILAPAGLTVGNGSVGKLTRTKLNLLIGVMNTYDSSGLPQNRPSAPITVSQPVAVATTPTVVQPSMTSCQFVELLINTDAIASSLANRARSALGCPTVQAPSVDLRINGESGTVIVEANSQVFITWKTTGMVSCSNMSGTVALSGSASARVGSGGLNAVLTCITADGRIISDSAYARINNVAASTVATSTINVTCAAYPATTTINNAISWRATTTRSGTGTSTPSFVWFGTDGLFSTTSTGVVSKTYTTAGAKTVSIAVTAPGAMVASASCNANIIDPAGTSAATTTATSTLSVRCSATPSVVWAGNTERSDTTWAAYVTGGDIRNRTYSWTGSENLSSNRQQFTKSYRNQGTKNATVTVTSAGQSASADCSVLVTSEETDPECNGGGRIATTTPPTTPTTTPSTVATVNFGGQVTGVINCYEDDGSLHSRMKQIIVSPCGGSSVLGNNTMANASSTSSYKFLWNSTDGHPLPTVGQNILGTANEKPYAVADSEYCENVSTADSAASSAAISVGWLLDYQLSAGSGNCTTSSSGSTSTDDDFSLTEFFLMMLEQAVAGGVMISW